jgi:hypothetical protein
MKALQFMALSRSEGPPVFFDFDGKDAGLSLPTMEKIWPQHHGYSVCCWLRAEAFTDPLGSPNYQPRIFRYRATPMRAHHNAAQHIANAKPLLHTIVSWIRRALESSCTLHRNSWQTSSFATCWCCIKRARVVRRPASGSKSIRSSPSDGTTLS